MSMNAIEQNFYRYGLWNMNLDLYSGIRFSLYLNYGIKDIKMYFPFYESRKDMLMSLSLKLGILCYFYGFS